MDIRLGSLFFPESKGDGPQSAEQVVRFPRAVRQVVAGIVGYSATFQGDDHHLGKLQMALEAIVDGADPQNVTVRGTFGLRDWSNSWDDPYTGTVQFALVGELEAAVPPGPGEARPDLIIVGMEVNQVIQHFRSQFHLDSPNVFPDNSVRLVANKGTGVRVYVDYDRNSGLSNIPSMTGTLDVIAANGITMTVVPVVSIAPRRDSSIDRRIADHTLNFNIPEALCRGMVTLRCQVRSAVDATQFSEIFEKQVVFEPLLPLSVFGVGINYTGPDVIAGQPTGAPTQFDFLASFPFTEQLYPVPNVLLTGFQTINYDEEVKSNLANGCEKMGDLRDAIGEMRGDSTDVFLGLLNTGVDTGSVKGCGSGDLVTAVSIVDRQATTAHELGHALGRRHAPCDNVGRCNRPKGTDENYPDYAGYDSDSIGEYGFDTRFSSIKDPAVAHDIMGYSDDDWISPYTYKALMSRIPALTAAADFAAAAVAVPHREEDRAEWRKQKIEQLFLNLRIHRDRRIELEPAFHFAAYPNAVGATRTPFVIEFLDEKGEVLTTDCLYGRGDSCCCCTDGKLWPKHIVQAVPFDTRAKKLAIFEDDRLVHEQDIPDPPTLRLTCTNGDRDSQSDALSFDWMTGDAHRREGRLESKSDLWYLLQWRDRHGTWRGVMPRTQRTRADVPKRLFGRQSRVAVRVLATSGIATGLDVWEGDLYAAPLSPRRREPTLVLQGVNTAATQPQPLPQVLRVAPLDRFGVGLATPEVVWFSGNGAELARGRSLDLGVLSPGRHVVRAVLLDTGAGGAVASFLIERGRDGAFRLVRAYDRGRR
jgi:hypothetical protein